MRSPSVQESLQPGQAVNVLHDRIKHVSKLNSDIADWLQVSGFPRTWFADGRLKLQ
jgi:hypothetical protein